MTFPPSPGLQVPQSVDPSEDEGFQSASNLTPDSQSEPGMTPEIDLWDAVLTYEPSKQRCWEQVGWYVALPSEALPSSGVWARVTLRALAALAEAGLTRLGTWKFQLGEGTDLSSSWELGEMLGARTSGFTEAPTEPAALRAALQ